LLTIVEASKLVEAMNSIGADDPATRLLAQLAAGLKKTDDPEVETVWH